MTRPAVAPPDMPLEEDDSETASGVVKLLGLAKTVCEG